MKSFDYKNSDKVSWGDEDYTWKPLQQLEEIGQNDMGQYEYILPILGGRGQNRKRSIIENYVGTLKTM